MIGFKASTRPADNIFHQHLLVSMLVWFAMITSILIFINRTLFYMKERCQGQFFRNKTIESTGNFWNQKCLHDFNGRKCLSNSPGIYRGFFGTKKVCGIPHLKYMLYQLCKNTMFMKNYSVPARYHFKFSKIKRGIVFILL